MSLRTEELKHMKLPGFAAQASLYQSRTSYRMMAGAASDAARVVPAAAACSACYAYRTGPYVFRGNRLCCLRVCAPFAGCRNVCWVEACNPFPDGGILV
jgi:hypothetical protein